MDNNIAIGEWHYGENEHPSPVRPAIFAYTYRHGFDNDTIAGDLHFTNERILAYGKDKKVLCWAYIDEDIPHRLLGEWLLIEKENIRQSRLERIQELEKQISELKKEL